LTIGSWRRCSRRTITTRITDILRLAACLYMIGRTLCACAAPPSSEVRRLIILHAAKNCLCAWCPWSMDVTTHGLHGHMQRVRAYTSHGQDGSSPCTHAFSGFSASAIRFARSNTYGQQNMIYTYTPFYTYTVYMLRFYVVVCLIRLEL
jgi:hypothetical protein